MSPDFSCAVVDTPSHLSFQISGNEGRKYNEIALLETNVFVRIGLKLHEKINRLHDTDYKPSKKGELKKNCCFTADSKFVVFETSYHYMIFRAYDGSELCFLHKRNISFTYGNNGNIRSVTGIVDVPSSKFWPWSVTNLINIGNYKMNLFNEDMSEDLVH